jgi:glycosyltransferase involved in cell wall biosynthesis
MRLAWFSPLPPVRSGIATYSAAIVPRLCRDHRIDVFVDRRSGAPRGVVRGGPGVFDAHDFVWKHQREPYDLSVYQMGNASCHDYMWAYLAHYPGLVVLHDARLHQARARQLLSANRAGDYRAEFAYERDDHRGARRDVAEYAVEGLGGPIYHLWRMIRVVMRTARMVAVHNERVAADLGDEYPGVPIDTIRMGVSLTVPDGAASQSSSRARARIRREIGVSDEAIVFAAFGTVTAEKRIAAIVRAIAALAADGCDAHLLVVGDRGEGAPPGGARVHVAGYVTDAAIGDYLSAADACLCLRWPTTQETSASWLQCLAAARPTVISDLAHLVDIPSIDPLTWRASHGSCEPVTIAIDLVDEDRALLLAMRRLAQDAGLRTDLGRAGRAYWSARHTLDVMATDYARVIADAIPRRPPAVADLPAHFTHDDADQARAIARVFGVVVDILGEGAMRHR